MYSALDALLDLEASFSRQPGSDRFLVSREAMYEWIHGVEAQSDRMSVESIGLSTGGRDMLLVTISSPQTIRAIDSVRHQRAALSDAQLLADPANSGGHRAGAKPVVLITAGIHADEVGGVQLMPEVIATLATSRAERIRRILDRTIILLIPTLNPDGMDLVHEWYASTLGTAAEGTAPPQLYHLYAGHDNNRDWYTHALAETRNVVDAIHRVWRPNVVLDLHQMGEHSLRYFVPPYLEPAEPHVHPLINSLSSSVGTWIATEHHRQGHRGVASGVLFDGYSPTRSFQTYHGGVRILAESASARLASPSTVDRAQITVRRGFDPRVPGVHNPMPWDSGVWRLRDIIDYHLTTIHALLDHVSTHAEDWLRDQWSMLADEVRVAPSPMYAITPLRQQIDPTAAADLIRTLQRGDVHLEIVAKPDQHYSPGTIIVRDGQPFGSYARTLLDVTPYPEMATSPYDVTSHCLPIHMGVEVEYTGSDTCVESQPLRDVDLAVFPGPTAADTGQGSWLAIDPRSHASIRIVSHALRNGAEVRRLLRPHFDGGRVLRPGTWLIAYDHALEGMSRAHEESVRTWLVRPVERGTAPYHMPSVGIYTPWSGDAVDAGWLRLMLEHSGIPYQTLRDEEIRRGNLTDFDIIIFANQPAEDLVKGNRADVYPAPYAGGLGQTGLAQLLTYLTSGGSIIAIDGAILALAGPLGLPIRFPLASLTADVFGCPGVVVRVAPESGHPLMLGIEDPFPAMLIGKNAFGRKSPHDDAPFAARFAENLTVVSGRMRGPELLSNLGAVADIPIGRGIVTGFAFRPHFRTQTLASYAPLINAIMRAGQSNPGGNT